MYVFICEDEDLSKELINNHFNSEQITYAAIVKETQRAAVCDALETIV